jgi:hypothetical protein
MKKVIFGILVLIVMICIVIFFINRDQTIVSDNGVIVSIDTNNKTLGIDIGEREYKIPEAFICSRSTRIYKSDVEKEKEKIQLIDLKPDQRVVVKYDYYTSKVYEIVVKNSKK